MIDVLHLQNFQRHTETALEFHPGINVIEGTNDAGKTALFRALYWLLFNRPSGDAFIQHGKKQCVVSARIDGQLVQRKKGKSVNSYTLNRGELSGFGTSVPEEIQDLANVDEINFSRQLDPPFLLSQNPGDIGRQLNNTVDLTIIDQVVSKLNGNVRKQTQEIKWMQQKLDECDETISELPCLDELEEMITSWEKAKEKLMGDKDRLAKLVSLENEYQRAKDQHQVAVRLAGVLEDCEEKLSQLARLKQEYEEQSRRVEELRSSHQTFLRTHEDLKRTKVELIAAQEEFDRFKEELEICPLCEREL